jgi:hypothetical protein
LGRGAIVRQPVWMQATDVAKERILIGSRGGTAEMDSLCFLGATSAPFWRRPGLLIYRAHTLPKRGLEIRWPTVLSEEIGEGLVGKLLEVLHAIFGEQVQSTPGFVIELNSLPGHGALSVAGGWSNLSPLIPQSKGFSIETEPRKRR